MKKVFVWINKIFIFPVIKIFIESIQGKENLPTKENFIICANHQHSLDNWLIGYVLRDNIEKIRFLGAKKGLKWWFQSALLYYLSNTIVFDKNKNSREEILKKLEKVLEEGKILIIYPEGDCNKGEKLLKGKTGAVELALRTGKKIVPVGIEYKKSSLKKIIRIGKPIELLKEKKEVEKFPLNSKERKEFLQKVTDDIMKEISRLCKKPYFNENYHSPHS